VDSLLEATDFSPMASDLSLMATDFSPTASDLLSVDSVPLREAGAHEGEGLSSSWE
jgi:hypothetical protein